MRWLRYGGGAFLILGLLLLARREALRRGRRGLALALPLIGVAFVCFLVSISPLQNPNLANAFLLLSLLCIIGFIILLLWQGFR
jgi:hypothetical protein